MASIDPSADRPNYFTRLADFWPILVTLVTVIIALAAWQARADQQISDLSARSQRFEQLVPEREGRLARLEAKQDATNDALGRVVAQLDRIEQRQLDAARARP